jgi:AcrR family transcriptional regulator
MRRTKEEADHTRQSLLDAALEVFSQKGFDAARLEDIAEVAGVTRGAIYHHFGSKADLFKTLIQQAQGQGNQAVMQAINEGGSFAEIARRVLVYSMRLLEEDVRFREVMALLLYKTAGSTELGNFPHQRYEEGRAQIEAITGFFRMGLEQQAVRETLDPMIAARAFIAYQNGLIMLWLAAPEAFSIKKDANALADVFIHGII